ncbi:MAG: selenium cofactor biosynthesis protein YqeC [Colwellia sp.]
MQINNLNAENNRLIQTLLTIDNTKTQKAPITISIVGAGGKTHLSYWLANFCKQLGHKVCITTTTKMYLPDKAHYDNIIELNNKTNNDINNAKADIHTPSITFIYKNKLTDKNLNVSSSEPNKSTNKEPSKVKGLSLSEVENIRKSALFSLVIIEADGANHQAIKAPARHEPCTPQCSDIVIAVTGAETIFSKADSNKIHRWPQFSAITHCKEDAKIDKTILKRLLNSPQGMFKGAPSQATKIWLINKCDLAINQDALLALATDLLNDEPLLTSVWLTQLNASTAIKKVLIK